MVAMVSAQAYHMRERKINSDNEWIGWVDWIKNDFAQGTVRKDWIELNLGQWFDPKFRNFIDNEIIGPVIDNGIISFPRCGPVAGRSHRSMT